jgi:hypothetical protein
MERDLIACLKNYSPNYGVVSSPLELEEIKSLCLKSFDLKVYSEDEDFVEEGSLLIRPYLICLKPFCVVYCTKDSFYERIQGVESLVLYLSPTITVISGLDEISSALNTLWNELILFGVKTLSLSGERMMDNRKAYRVILEKTAEDGNPDKKVYQLI